MLWVYNKIYLKRRLKNSMKKKFKFKTLLVPIFACSIFLACEEGCEMAQVQGQGSAVRTQPVRATYVERMSIYDRQILSLKEFTVVGIVSIRVERPTEMLSSSGRTELVAPIINVRLMEEARRMGAHDIIDVRVDKLADGSWVAATALAIRYEKGFFEPTERSAQQQQRRLLP
jgi:hypothetical protein